MRMVASLAVIGLVAQVGFVIPEEVAVTYFTLTRAAHHRFVQDHCNAYDLLHAGPAAATDANTRRVSA